MNYICIFSKPPIPGKTKSRLAQVIGDANAANLAKSMLQDICQTMSLAKEAEVQIWHPPEYHANSFDGIISSDFSFFKQQGKDLGERMSNTFKKLLDSNMNHKVLIIGSDCITHTIENIEEVFSILNQTDVVMQPSDDGGYVLIGQSRWIPKIFNHVDWGSDKVFAQTMSQIKKHNINFKELQKSFDIDNAGDLNKLKKYIKINERPNTMQWFNLNHSR